MWWRSGLECLEVLGGTRVTGDGDVELGIESRRPRRRREPPPALGGQGLGPGGAPSRRPAGDRSHQQDDEQDDSCVGAKDQGAYLDRRPGD